MERKVKKITLLTLLLIFMISCYKIDFVGFVHIDTEVNKRFEQSMDWNSNTLGRKISVSADSYSFLVGSDTHIGGTENVSAFINSANDHDFFVIIGDVTTGREADYEIANNLFDSLCQKPLFLVAGNHDIYFGGWSSFLNYFGSSTYIVEVETSNAKDLFVFLETGSSMLGKLQSEWLKNILENERPNYRNCLVFSHVNVKKSGFDPAASMIMEDASLLMELFYKHNVDYFFQGHTHDKHVQKFGHTTYITLDALVDNNPKTISYLLFSVNDGDREYEFIEL